MARTKKSETPVEENVIVEKTVTPKVQPKAKKKFDAHDLINCRSITCGTLLLEGGKSGLIYRWGDIDEEYEVEYQDLIYDVHSTGSFAKYPRFIVLDEDFVEQNGLNEIYERLFSQGDLKDILLNVPQDQLEAAIAKLPKGAQESIKIMASTMISNGQLDSVKKIQILDKIFGTQMLLHLATN